MKESKLRTLLKKRDISSKILSNEIGSYPQFWDRKFLGSVSLTTQEVEKISKKFNIDRNEILQAHREDRINCRETVSKDQLDPYLVPNINFSKISERVDLKEKYQKQRIVYGFDETELIDFNKTVAQFLFPRIKKKLEIEKTRKKKCSHLENAYSQLSEILTIEEWGEQEKETLKDVLFVLS